MMWMTWRQHRTAMAVLAVGMLGLAAVLLTATSMGFRAADAYAAQEGLGALLGNLEFLNNSLPLMHVLVGMFLGAPLVSRELEHNTFRFAWTQGVTRVHWLRTKVLLVGAAIVVVSTAYAVAHASWFDVTDGESSSGIYESFIQGIVVFPALCLFAFVAGVTVGTVLKRTLPAMLVTLPITAVPPLFLYYQRPYYVPAEAMRVQDWDGPGFPVPEGSLLVDVGDLPSRTTPQTGGLELYTYQPVDRFYPLQFIEAGIYLGLAAMFFLVAVWWLQRKLR